MSEAILEVEKLKVYFNKKSNIFSKGQAGQIKAVDNINLTIHRNEIHGLVGESGSGKSTLGKAIMGLVPVTEGRITFKGKEITSKNKEKDRIKVQMVFQDPNSSLNANMKIKDILAEPMIVNKILSKSDIPNQLLELMEMIDLPADYLERYPHQLSGGQRQRIGVARAMTTNPELIVADEPTSALDVSVQAQLLNLLLKLKEEKGLSILFISHNLAVIRYISDYVSVMKKGKIVETGVISDIFNQPEHDYTKKLLRAIPQIRKFS